MSTPETQSKPEAREAPSRWRILARLAFAAGPALLAAHALDFIGRRLERAGYALQRAGDRIDDGIVKPAMEEGIAFKKQRAEAAP